MIKDPPVLKHFACFVITGSSVNKFMENKASQSAIKLFQTVKSYAEILEVDSTLSSAEGVAPPTIGA